MAKMNGACALLFDEVGSLGNCSCGIYHIINDDNIHILIECVEVGDEWSAHG